MDIISNPTIGCVCVDEQSTIFDGVMCRFCEQLFLRLVLWETWVAVKENYIIKNIMENIFKLTNQIVFRCKK